MPFKVSQRFELNHSTETGPQRKLCIYTAGAQSLKNAAPALDAISRHDTKYNSTLRTIMLNCNWYASIDPNT